MPKKESRERTAYLVKLGSFTDIARCVFSSGLSPKPLLAIQSGKKYNLCIPGERLGGSAIFYYAESERVGKFCVYAPKSEDSKEICEIKNDVKEEMHNYKLHKMPILEISDFPFKIKKEHDDRLRIVRAKDLLSLVRAEVSLLPEGEGMLRMYTFGYGSEQFISTFFMKNVLLYTKSNLDKRIKFLSYDYLNDAVKESETLPEERVVISIITLAEPFPFFKI